MRTILRLVLLSVAACLTPAHAIEFTNFNEFGTSVNGFQDDFNGGVLNPSWLEFDGNNDDASPLFTLSGTGTLIMKAASGDPNKLLYNPGTAYNSSTQEILALVRCTIDGLNFDGVRGGIGGVANATTGQGINLLFRQPGQNGPNRHFNLLDDAISWGPGTPAVDLWTVGSYKWMRLVISNSNTISAKVWDAGGTPEPAGFDLTWNQGARTGLAGLVTDSLSGTSQYEVGYVLIKANDLPSITVPEPASLGLLALGGIGMTALRRRRR